MLFSNAYTTSALSTSESSSRIPSPPPHVVAPARCRSSIPLTRRRLSNALTLALLGTLPFSAYLAIDGVLRSVKGNAPQPDGRWLSGAQGERLKRSLREIGVGVEVVDIHGEVVDLGSARRARARSQSNQVDGAPRWTTHGIAGQNSLLRRQEDTTLLSPESASDDHAPKDGIRPLEDGVLRLDPQHISWWGSADVVGPSPFDYVPSDRGNLVTHGKNGKRKRKRVLFLTGGCSVGSPPLKPGLTWGMLADYKDYLERMNTNTYEVIDGEW